jgi:hypothetical protein
MNILMGGGSDGSAGDVLVYLLETGCLKMWLIAVEDDGRELRVPAGEPSSVKTAGWSVLDFLLVQRYLVDLCNSGNQRWKFCDKLCMGGGVM